MAIVKSGRVLLGLAVLVALVSARWIDLRAWAGDIKGDEATYLAMTLSLVHDGDLYYEPEDYTRFVRYYPSGPGGIFLKRRYTLGWGTQTPVPSDQSLVYGKPFVYPVAAAPFVAIGGLGGLVVFNWLLFGVCLWCGAVFCRAAAGRAWAAIRGVAFFAASVAPIYMAWATPEVFNMALVTVAYFLWLYKRVAPADAPAWLRSERTTLVAALLIGVAMYSKVTHLGLIAPLALDALFRRRLGLTAAIGAMFVAAAVSLVGVNLLVTGDANYQGAPDAFSRRSFAGSFPFDPAGTSFDVKGSAMVTNDADTGRVLSEELVAQIPINFWYFLVGRHAGLLPYYLPGVVIAVWWLVGARRAPFWQWATAFGVAGSVAGLLVLLPDSWNGGGGPPGNRYFLSLYPPLLFLVRPVAASLIAGTSLVGGLLFVGPLIAHPYDTSRAPWLPVERRPINWLPIELTLVNDLPCRLNSLRCPLLWPFVPAEPSVQFYYMDGRTYSAEPAGTWIAGGDSTDIIVKTDQPPSRVRIEFSGPIANTIEGHFADRPFSTSLPAGGKVAVTLANPTPFRYHQNWVYVFHLEVENGFVPAETEPGSTDRRRLGVFMKPIFEYRGN